MLDALVFLESAGRPDVIAGVDPIAASGLTQILAETGRDLLGMRIDLPASKRLTRRIALADAQGRKRLVMRLQARRRLIDARFDPRQSLAAHRTGSWVSRGGGITYGSSLSSRSVPSVLR
jgi:hypothetical protein